MDYIGEPRLIPPAWLPMAQTVLSAGFAGAFGFATSGGDAAVTVGYTSAGGAAGLCLFGALYYEAVTRLRVRVSDPEFEPVAEREHPRFVRQVGAGAMAAETSAPVLKGDGWRRFDYKSHVVGRLARSKVDPALPEFVHAGQMSRLAFGLVRCDPPLPLSYRAWTPDVFRKDNQFRPLLDFMRARSLTMRGGVNKSDELTEAGVIWMYTILKAYGPPPSAWVLSRGLIAAQ